MRAEVTGFETISVRLRLARDLAIRKPLLFTETRIVSRRVVEIAREGASQHSARGNASGVGFQDNPSPEKGDPIAKPHNVDGERPLYLNWIALSGL